MKPLIGITSNYIKDSRFGTEAHIGGKGQFWQALADDYVQAVHLAGGIPVMIPVIPDTEIAGEYLTAFDGLIVSGGADISHLLYEEDLVSRVGECCAERDEAEFALLKGALEIPDFPVLGICRGCQLLNVALGGTLVLIWIQKKQENIFLRSNGCSFLRIGLKQFPVPGSGRFLEQKKGSILTIISVWTDREQALWLQQRTVTG